MFGKDAIAVVNPNGSSRRNYRPLWSQKNGQKYNSRSFEWNCIQPKTGTIFVTGKNWDKIFEITVSE
jgi:glutamine cyclotransferase